MREGPSVHMPVNWYCFRFKAFINCNTLSWIPSPVVVSLNKNCRKCYVGHFCTLVQSKSLTFVSTRQTTAHSVKLIYSKYFILRWHIIFQNLSRPFDKYSFATSSRIFLILLSTTKLTLTELLQYVFEFSNISCYLLLFCVVSVIIL